MKKALTGISCVLGSLLVTSCSVKPHPLATNEQLAISDQLQALYAAEPKSHTITVSEAVVRALTYNLNHRIQEANIALASGQLTLAKWHTLPALTGTYNYYNRNNPEVQLLSNGSGGLVPNTTSVTPQTVQSGTFGLNWNILDFGLSYVRAKQQANQVLIAEEQRRKVEQQLIGEVIVSYWKAYMAQQLYNDIQQFSVKVNQALNHSDVAMKEKVTPVKEQLEYQYLLLQSMHHLNDLKSNLIQAKMELATLLNLPADSQFTLVNPNFGLPKLGNGHIDMKKVDLVAIVKRPELRQASYQCRNALYALTAAKLKLLPGITFTYDYNNTNNPYYLNSQWMSTNLQATWNLMQLASNPVEVKVSKAQINVAELQRMALTVGVLTEIRMAYMQYKLGIADYNYATRTSVVAVQLYDQAKVLADNDIVSQSSMVQSGVNAINARIEKAIAQAKVFDAFAKVYQAVGLQLVPDIKGENLSDDIKTVQQALKSDYADGFSQQINAAYQQLSPEFKAGPVVAASANAKSTVSPKTMTTVKKPVVAVAKPATPAKTIVPVKKSEAVS